VIIAVGSIEHIETYQAANFFLDALNERADEFAGADETLSYQRLIQLQSKTRTIQEA
jgi:hypothetical protein